MLSTVLRGSLVPCTVVVFLAGALPVLGGKPALRDEVCLRGTWNNGVNVPERSGRVIGANQTYSYQRDVAVPANWTGRIIKLCFGGVNTYSEIFVNGTLAGTNLGFWAPFEVDVTSLAAPGQSFTLRVDVRSVLSSPVVVNGNLQVPVGCDCCSFDGGNSGIVEDVFLRAYGTVAISDAFIQTSFRNKTIKVDYTLKNHSAQSRTVSLQGEIAPDNGGAVVKTIAGNPITLAAGEERVVSVTGSWADPLIWWPYEPNLYHLTSKVIESSSTIDQETRRFGFREIWIEGTDFILNGVHINLRGDNIACGEVPSSFYDSTWVAGIYRKMMNEINLNCFRRHNSTTPEYLMDIGDETGMMIINESPIYGASFNPQHDGTYFQNTLRWWPSWITWARNHPSVIEWSVANEALGMISLQQHQELYRLTKQLDPTRPCMVEERESWAAFDMDVRMEHYPEGYMVSPVPGNLYNWSQFIAGNRPSGAGEILWGVTDKEWWKGTMVRTMRYAEWDDIRMYKLNFLWNVSNTDAQFVNIANGHNAVALFDYDYDNLGVAPIKGTGYPDLAAGTTANRTLVLYNDEYFDEIVTAMVEVRSGGTTYATGMKSYMVPLGDHVEIPCSFEVPYRGGSPVEMLLSTRKDGVVRFSEAKRFDCTGGTTGTSSSTVTLGGSGFDLDRPYIQLSPRTITAYGETGTDAINQVIDISNGAGGTMNPVSAHMTYGPGASGWATPSVSGTGNDQQITLQFATAALGGGTYTAQLVVSAVDAEPDSAVCPITLVVVGPDYSAPLIVSASGTESRVRVIFSEPVEYATATNPANYALSGGAAVSSAELSADETSVVLSTSVLTKGSAYTLTVNNVRDKALNPNTIAANSTVAFEVIDEITSIRIYPRPGHATRMTNTYFEGSYTSVDGPWVNFYNINSAPADGQWTELSNLSGSDRAFKVVRYVSPNGFGNVSEIEFYSGGIKLTGTPFGTEGTWNNSGNDYTKPFDGDVNTFFDCSQANAYCGLVLNDSPTDPGSARGAKPGRRAFILRLVAGGATVNVAAYEDETGEGTRVDVYDLRGGLVRSVPIGIGENGRAVAALDTEDKPLAAGQYVVRVGSGGAYTTQRIGVVR